ncbi:uncharacterized protein LOC120163628 [Hibiscus syriacus]|uniref:uncharacterized protein LOC120163628 n=1 Tax=Hibiscus syriacus TaxID=106335 RepID=UPI001925022C|nr:uncharacterized protein LOC120163628 [Hibiscus syriacus]
MVLQYFATRSSTSVMSLRYKLQFLKKGEDIMRVYIAKVKEVCDALASCRSLIPLVGHITSILKGLLRECQPFMAVITSSDDMLPLDKVCTMLIDVETQITGFAAQEEIVVATTHLTHGSGPGDFSKCSYSNYDKYRMSTACDVHHVTPDADIITHCTGRSGPGKLVVGDGVSLAVDLVGNTTMQFSSRMLLVNDLLHVPGITQNLLSVSKFARDINAVQSDWGGEYRNLSSVLLTMLLCPHMSEQNSVVERNHRHIIELAWVLNGLSPHKKLWGKKLEYEFMKVFECKCFPHLRMFQQHKHDFRSQLWIFSSSKATVPCKQKSTTIKLITVCDSFKPIVDVNTYSVDGGSGDMGQTTIDMGDTSLGAAVQQEQGGATSVNAAEDDDLVGRVQPVAVSDFFHNVAPPPKLYLASYDDMEPVNVYEALQPSHWRVAVHVEFEALRKNGTWILLKLPEGRSVVGCKWLFKLKKNPDGSINRYKARLVYMNNSFLHGDIHDEVFMQQPHGFEQVAADGSPLIEEVVRLLGSEFALTDLGDPYYFLGIEVKRYGSSLILSQHKFILELLMKTTMSTANSTSTPMIISAKLNQGA